MPGRADSAHGAEPVAHVELRRGSNARATRIKPLVHDGFGVWCAARRLTAGRFVRPRDGAAPTPLLLTPAQFDALVLGLPWQRLSEVSVITRV